MCVRVLGKHKGICVCMYVRKRPRYCCSRVLATWHCASRAGRRLLKCVAAANEAAAAAVVV